MKSVWAFQAAPKAGEVSERTVPPDETERRLEPLRSKIPITRVSDLTPLDPLRLPVFTAVTPLAKDLTTHAGKGLSLLQAKLSALMEAVERVSAERVAGEPVNSTFDRLRGGSLRPVDPTSLVLPNDSAYRSDKEFRWTAGFDLVAREAIVAPVDLVINPPEEGILPDVDTNGLASGNTLLEAVVHALCEVVERDAVSQLAFVESFGNESAAPLLCQNVALNSLPGRLGDWVERVLSQGLAIKVQALASDIGIPTFRAIIDDDGFPGPDGPMPVSFSGFGTHPDARIAVARAVTEAIQARLGTIQGARDAFNVTYDSRAPGARALRTIPFAEVASHPATDLLDDFGFITERLVARGFESILAFDLTRREFGVPVVRVRVPHLSCFLVNQRRVDWRCLRHLVS